MKNILIIKCGDTLLEIKEKQGDFEDWIIQCSNLPRNIFKIYNVSNGEQLRHPSEYIAAIITGSHANVNQRLPWIKQLKDWIVTARYSNIPVLGICFGHQIIAEALGGKAQLDSAGTYVGAVNIKLTESGMTDPLFKNLGSSFESYKMNSFKVVDLPLGAELLALNNESFKVEKIYGIQFHPEFNAEIMKMYSSTIKTQVKDKIRVKIKSEFKNQSVVSNFIDISLKF